MSERIAVPEDGKIGQSPAFLAYAIGPIALLVVLVFRHFGFIAREPGWLFALAIVASIISSRLIESWGDTKDSPMHLHGRLLLHTASVTGIIYMSGWGPMLVVAYAFGAIEDISVCGSATWKPALGWSLAGIAVGQAFIGVGWAPSFVQMPRAEGLGLVGAFLLAFVIRMAGATARQKELAEAALAHQALHDPLTQLPNRKLFVDRLGQAMARSRRSGDVPPAVMFLDLDRFKAVNDTLGHAAGDDLLLEVAVRVQSVLRETDTLARFGGDEFVVLCEGIDSQRAVDALATRISHVFTEPFEIQDHPVSIGVSIGVAVMEDDLASPESLLRDADSAMYRVKQERARESWGRADRPDFRDLHQR